MLPSACPLGMTDGPEPDTEPSALNTSAATPPSDSPRALEPAELEWRLDGEAREAPFSSRYADVYFSRHDGREESRFVFIEHNRLPARFRDWRESRAFVIGETGFGTGLNVMLAWSCFICDAPSDARLHIVSTEKHPLDRESLQRAWRAWPDLAEQAEALVDQWPDAVPGVHRLRLDARVTLDLHFGDAAESLAALDATVDAWLLDGFAPARNPDMWHAGLFHAMARASRPGTTFATFTCAGFVRRALREAGFAWRKVPGFGRKREMLCGELDTSSSDTPSSDTPRAATPWFMAPPRQRTTRVAVIGAGIAGSSVAESLARRGSRVTLIDREGVASAASGNPQAALYVKLAAEPNRQSLFYLAALLHARRWLASIDPARELWSDCGLLALAPSERERQRQARFLEHYALPAEVVRTCHAPDVRDREQALNDAEALHGNGERHANDALYYPGAGWVDPVALCQRLAARPGIETRRTALESLSPLADGWQLTLGDGTLTVDQVVFATGSASAPWLDGLPLQPIRGQISTLDLETLSTPEREAAMRLARVLCAEGYVLPPRNGALVFGATFSPNDTGLEIRAEDHRRNLAELARTAPALADALGPIDVSQLTGRTAIRAASPDKTPYAGPLPIAERWRHDYAELGKDAKRRFSAPGAHYPGLWVSTAHGSRGMVSAPLCAELIASRMFDEPMPLPRELVDHLHPGRRLIADLIRGH